MKICIYVLCVYTYLYASKYVSACVMAAAGIARIRSRGTLWELISAIMPERNIIYEMKNGTVCQIM